MPINGTGKMWKILVLIEEMTNTLCCTTVKAYGEKTLKKAKGSELHLTFTKEMGYESESLTHRSIPVTDAVFAGEFASVLKEFKCGYFLTIPIQVVSLDF